jgi:hypothetical protein
MLRLTLILLLLANGLYFAWSQGHLAVLGFAPAAQTEPARMQAQIKPDALRLLGNPEVRRPDGAGPSAAPASVPAGTPPATAPASAASAALAAAKATECLQSAALDDALAARVRSAAGNLPSGSWGLESVTVPARWIVYMGKFTRADLLAKKKSELRELDVSFEALQNASLEPGISLGGHETQALATSALAALNTQGVRTAKVVQEKPPSQRQILRLPAVDEALRSKLDAVKTALGSASLRACKT